MWRTLSPPLTLPVSSHIVQLIHTFPSHHYAHRYNRQPSDRRGAIQRPDRDAGAGCSVIPIPRGRTRPHPNLHKVVDTISS